MEAGTCNRPTRMQVDIDIPKQTSEFLKKSRNLQITIPR